MEKTNQKIKWTKFMDMHSGGMTKEPPYQYIYIEAPKKEAIIIFYNRFGHNPKRVTCTCCGEDYSIDEVNSLEESTAYERKCRYAYFDKNKNEIAQSEAWIRGEGMVDGSYGKYVEEQDSEKMKDMTNKYPDSDWKEYFKYIPLNKYLKSKDVLVIYSKDIKIKERKGSVPEQGYVWKE